MFEQTEEHVASASEDEEEWLAGESGFRIGEDVETVETDIQQASDPTVKRRT